MKRKRRVLLSWVLALAAFAVVGTKAFFPHHRTVALTLFALSWIPFLLAFRDKADRVAEKGRPFFSALKQSAGRLLWGGGLVALAYSATIWFPGGASPMAGKSPEEFDVQMRGDLKVLAALDGNLQAALDQVSADPLVQRRGEYRNYEERARARDHWMRYLDAAYELEVIQQRYRTFYQIPYSKHPVLHAKAFCLAFGAFVAEYRAAFRVVELVGDDPVLVQVLDEGGADGRLPAGTYRRFQRELAEHENILRLAAGRAYYPLMRRHVAGGGRDEVLARLDRAVEEVEIAFAGLAPVLIDSPLDTLEATATDAWLPVQKQVALGLSHIRATDRENFITADEAAALVPLLEPGDILLQRRNLYATNLGIPGFWPHAALYLGTPESIDEFFHGETPDGRPATAVLDDLCPGAVGRLAGADELGFRFRVIEAIEPGVVFTSLEQSAAADSLAVLRPRLPRDVKLRAAAEAIRHLGKPYDYNFDFSTDLQLVCSELICKAYESAGAAVEFQTVSVNGRPLFPPNRFAEKYALEAGREDRDLDLVLFLDGSEVQQDALEREEPHFCQSWCRPKWFVLTN